MRPGLFQLLTKVGMSVPTRKHQSFLEQHFEQPTAQSWKTFKNKLRSPAFVEAVKKDPRSDRKLRNFSENIGKHLQDRGAETFRVPSQSGPTWYNVKFHQESNRFSCNCGDWTYKQSTSRSKKADCKHVQMVKRELKAQGMAKTAQRRAAEKLLALFGEG